MVVGGERGGGDKGIEIFGVYFSEEQQAGEADKGQGEKRDGGDGTRRIGKRKFREDWGKRMGTFDALMWTVMAYGVEIWEWKEREMMEKAQEKLLKWLLGVNRMISRYMIRGNCKGRS